MPTKHLTVVADLFVKAISAPGVWLACKQDIYLSISLFGQHRCTRLLDAWFPLVINERFRFTKTYYCTTDPADAAEMLEDEIMVMELIQLSDICHGNIRLATYSCDARSFLYPEPSYVPSYARPESEILMRRSAHFPGIAPKVEFTCRTNIRRPEDLDLSSLEDAINKEHLAVTRLKDAIHNMSRNKRRSRSLQRYADVYELQNTVVRPPFVVRKAASDLTARCPGSAAKRPYDQKPRSRSRGRSRTRSQTNADGLLSERRCLRNFCRWCCVLDPLLHCSVCQLYERYTGSTYSEHPHICDYHRNLGYPERGCRFQNDETEDCGQEFYDSCSLCNSVLRDSGKFPTPVYSSDADEEVESLLRSSRYKPTYVSPRPRSVSPVALRSSLRSRLSPRVSPYSSPRVSSTYVPPCRCSPIPYTTYDRYYDSSRRFCDYRRDSLDDLALDFERAKTQTYRYLY